MRKAETREELFCQGEHAGGGWTAECNSHNVEGGGLPSPADAGRDTVLKNGLSDVEALMPVKLMPSRIKPWGRTEPGQLSRAAI